jgi:uncharacterized protein
MFLIAFTLGLVGSLHCLGMCGPIALSLPVRGGSAGRRVSAILLYNLGRVFMYSILGAIAGLLGKMIFVSGYQQILSIGLGILMLVFLFTSMNPKFPIAGKIYEYVKKGFAQLLTKRTMSSYLLLGALNGLLPCGMVYMAIAGSIVTGDSLNAAIFMSAFGAGTVPMMLSVSWIGTLLKNKFQLFFRRLFPATVFVMAVLLILRGLDLGIPYLSPKADVHKGMHACCHRAENK